MSEITLETKLEDIFRLTDIQKNAANKLSMVTVENLLRHLPSRYISSSSLRAISSLNAGEQVTIEGGVKKLEAKKTWARKLKITEAKIADASGEITAIWFHQPYISKMLSVGDLVRLEGKISEKNGRLSIMNPVNEKISQLSYHSQGQNILHAVYPATRGLSSRWFQYRIIKIFGAISSESIVDQIPSEILERYHLPSLWQALRAAHFPKNMGEVEAAKKRLSFDEIFFIQLSRMKERLRLESESSLTIPNNIKSLDAFLQSLSFTLTKAQTKVLEDILSDTSKKSPMARLLEGDVGSGKTVIAAAIAHQTTVAGFQTTYMAPTEILARQHFENFCNLLGGMYTKIGLLTSTEARVFPSKAFKDKSAHISKAQMLKWVESGEVKVLLGTHALLSSKIRFKNLALIVVDEQHRFGVNQRGKLAKSKSEQHVHIPHFLSMTATPIPRTLALTVFGDLDLSILDELPPGRTPIITKVLIKPEHGMSSGNRLRNSNSRNNGNHENATYPSSWDHIREEIEKGRQAFIICPRIDEGDDEKKSVKKEYEHVTKKTLPDLTTKMLHGKMKPKEKEQTLKDFRDRKIDILIATSVVEVGIDIPNATIMVVEGAESFGLAQLHQLRGRIGRGEHQSYFYAISYSASPKTASRLKALEKAKNGFELAEFDLAHRGPGELTGKNQWGLSDVAMEALKNIKMVEAARTEARSLLEADEDLKEYPHLQESVRKLNCASYHFE